MHASSIRDVITHVNLPDSTHEEIGLNVSTIYIKYIFIPKLANMV